MPTLAALKARLRLELGDFVTPFQATFDGDGFSTRFALPYSSIVADAGLAVGYDDGTPLLAGTDYGLDPVNGWLTTSVAVPANRTLVVDAHHAEVFNDSDLELFIATALDLHNHNRFPPVTVSKLEGAETYAVILKAKEQGLWVLATDASRDIDIITVEGVRVPRSQRFDQLMTMVTATQRLYEELAENLNIGVARIEQLQLRRKSRITNRLVPIYLSREVDDIRRPVRVYTPQDTAGAKLAEPTVANYDIQVYRGTSFVETFTFTADDGTARDLTGYVFEAQVYGGKFANVAEVEFTVDATAAATGSLTLSLTRDETYALNEGPDYVYVVKWWDANGEPTTVLQGSVLVEGDQPTTQREPD